MGVEVVVEKWRQLYLNINKKNDTKFWEHRIIKLPERWQKVVEQNGEYVVQ